MSLINIAGLAPDNTGRAIRVNQFGNLLTSTGDFFPNGAVLLGSAQATALQADSAPLATADTANQRPGWYYKNTSAGNKINWYFYSDADDNNDRTYAQLAGLTCTMAIDGQHPPFFEVYTKPKAPLNPAHPWYDKKVIYQNQDTDLNLFAGQKCLMYFAATAQDFPKNPNQLREINCPVLTEGSETPLPSDEILFITLQSDSSFAPGTFAGVVSQVGFKFVDNIVEYELKANIASGSVSADVNITNSYLDTHSTLYLGGTPVADGTNALPVVVNGTVQIDPLDTIDVNVVNTSIPITNTKLDSLSFITDKGINYLNTTSTFGFPIENSALKTIIYDSTGNNANSSIYPLIVRPVAATITTNEWTIANFSGTGVGSVSEALEASNYDSITVFGIGTHSGGGGDPSLTYQYSLDNITFFDTPSAITIPNATAFQNSRTLGIPWMRFKITSHALDTITLNICRK